MVLPRIPPEVNHLFPETLQQSVRHSFRQSVDVVRVEKIGGVFGGEVRKDATSQTVPHFQSGRVTGQGVDA